MNKFLHHRRYYYLKYMKKKKYFIAYSYRFSQLFIKYKNIKIS